MTLAELAESGTLQVRVTCDLRAGEVLAAIDGHTSKYGGRYDCHSTRSNRFLLARLSGFVGPGFSEARLNLPIGAVRAAPR